MFYISPYYPNGQVVFHEIALTIGTVPGNILYLLSVAPGRFSVPRHAQAYPAAVLIPAGIILQKTRLYFIIRRFEYVKDIRKRKSKTGNRIP